MRHGFYGRFRNPLGKGFSHKYRLKEKNGEKIIFDKISCLMWQQSGSDEEMLFGDVKKYIDKLNEKQFAGLDNWRLPTLEEAMILIEPGKKNNLYIDPIFDSEQMCIWTADQVKGESSNWLVNFGLGDCEWNDFKWKCGNHVRAVSSRKPFRK
jgi:hypothetical protein